MSRRQTVIALGSNIGNSTATIVAAAKRVGTLPGTKLMALSTVCTSRPAVVLEQPDFKNAVMLIETDIEPRELLRCLQEIEREFGRVTSGTDYLPSGPRTLDL
ncbi:MAG: 2-amino-4-hydroxy-6-hydroxymethyldihydropteridine diphosphokinase, partial [Coriobacteriia bacterium]|nr:2-amino-4-hydroxy-6-hydroxymethyldihydropteridine diphosphokinase [Coriobacteriia bacterium]